MPALAGRVTTGFSQPYVAVYAGANGTVSYSNGMKLARGVDVEISPEGFGSDSYFYADNALAEAAAGGKNFTGGTFTLTVDGLSDAAERLVYGLPTAASNWTNYGDSVSVPYVGIGFVARVQYQGTVAYVPIIICKAIFNLRTISAATEEREVSFQTQQLTGMIFKGDDTNHTWLKIGDEVATEDAAVAAIRTAFGITTSGS